MTDRQEAQPLMTAECPDSRYDIEGWHCWGTNGFVEIAEHLKL